MTPEQLKDFLAEIEDDISYIMDGYYAGCEVPIIEKIKRKIESLIYIKGQ